MASSPNSTEFVDDEALVLFGIFKEEELVVVAVAVVGGGGALSEVGPLESAVFLDAIVRTLNRDMLVELLYRKE